MDKLDKGLFLLLFSFLPFYFLELNNWWIGAVLLFLIGVFVLKVKFFYVFLILMVVASRVFSFEFLEYNRFQDLINDNSVFEFRVLVCGEPDVRLKHANYVVCIKTISIEEDFGDSLYMKRLLVKTNVYPKYKFGDELFLFGKIIEPFETEEFSYIEYLKIFKVDGILKPVSGIEKVGSNDSLKRKIYDLKFLFLDITERNLDEPYASLVNGLLLGSRKGFTNDVNDKLATTGLTHIVAVSGYNVSLVILFIERSLFFIPRNIRFYILVLAILVFAVLAGLSASVIRACIMGVIAVMVVQYGYTQSVLRALLLSGVVMVLYNPAFLYIDLGFQLSFFSTLGVLYLSKFFQFDFIPQRFGLREAFTLTIASQLATLPTVLFYFGNLSLVSPLANVLVAPILPVMMLLGFLLFVFSKFSTVVGLLSFITTSLGFLFFKILDFTASFKYSMVKLPTLSFGILVIVYSLLLLIIVGSRKSFES
jgi:competence protein ComEC